MCVFALGIKRSLRYRHIVLIAHSTMNRTVPITIGNKIIQSVCSTNVPAVSVVGHGKAHTTIVIAGIKSKRLS